MNVKERLKEFVSGTDTSWKQKAQWKRDNRYWTKESAAIAVKLSYYVKSNDLEYTDVAVKLGYPTNTVQRMVKGKYDFRLSEIRHIEDTFNIELINYIAHGSDK